MRQQLRLLWKPNDAELVFQMLPWLAAQGTTDARSQPNLNLIRLCLLFLPLVLVSADLCLAVARRAGGARGGNEGGRGEGAARAASEAGEQVHDVQAARGVDGVQVQVRDDVLWDPPVPGAARVRVRLQSDGEGADRQGQPGRQGREAAEDLRIVKNCQGYNGLFTFRCLGNFSVGVFLYCVVGPCKNLI